MSIQINPPKMVEPQRGSDIDDFMRSIGINPKGDISPQDMERFNREYNDFLDKRRQKEENYDYEFKEHDAILARGYSKGGSVSQYDQLFFEKGKEYGVDPMILKGIASVESNFNPKAVGPKTRSGQAQGMMQFIPAMQKPYGITDPFDPEQSVTGAARMMSDLLKRYKGDVGKALEAYNGGPRLVGKSTQTRNYAEKVQRKAQLFAKNTQKPSIEVAGTPTQGPSALQRTPQVAQEAPKMNLGSKTVAQGPSLDGMSEDYKAAVALSYLTEDDSDGLTVTERAEQLLADQEEAASISGNALSQIFSLADAGMEGQAEEDPFAVYAAVQNPQKDAMRMAQQVPQFAEGGSVTPLKLATGSFVNPMTGTSIDPFLQAKFDELMASGRENEAFFFFDDVIERDPSRMTENFYNMAYYLQQKYGRNVGVGDLLSQYHKEIRTGRTLKMLTMMCCNVRLLLKTLRAWRITQVAFRISMAVHQICPLIGQTSTLR